MFDYVKRMMKEHSELIVKVAKLDEFFYGNNGINIHTDINNNKTQEDLLRNMTEFANKCIQLRSMKVYLNALECRLNNEGVFFENGEYLERVGVISKVSVEPENEKHEEEF